MTLISIRTIVDSLDGEHGRDLVDVEILRFAISVRLRLQLFADALRRHLRGFVIVGRRNRRPEEDLFTVARSPYDPGGHFHGSGDDFRSSFNSGSGFGYTAVAEWFRRRRHHHRTLHRFWYALDLPGRQFGRVLLRADLDAALFGPAVGQHRLLLLRVLERLLVEHGQRGQQRLHADTGFGREVGRITGLGTARAETAGARWTFGQGRRGWKINSYIRVIQRCGIAGAYVCRWVWRVWICRAPTACCSGGLR